MQGIFKLGLAFVDRLHHNQDHVLCKSGETLVCHSDSSLVTLLIQREKLLRADDIAVFFFLSGINKYLKLVDINERRS